MVTAVDPGVVTVVDRNWMLDPDGHFQSVVDGVTVRWADGIHISKDGGEWLQPADPAHHRPTRPGGPSQRQGRGRPSLSASIS